LKFTSVGCKRLFFPIKAFEEEAYVKKSKFFEVYQKETHVCRYKNTLYGFKQLDAEYLIYSRSVVKYFYDRDIRIVTQKSGMMDC
jgi:hypothetical protein